MYRAARAYADDHGAVRLSMVKVAVGELLGANPELLRSAWNFVVQESIDEGVPIEVEMRPVHQVCPSCGKTPLRVQQVLPRYCTNCSGALRTSEGNELSLLQISFEAQVAEFAGSGGRH